MVGNEGRDCCIMNICPHPKPESQRQSTHALAEAAFARCVSCQYSSYRPRSGGCVAFLVEAIRCNEGVLAHSESLMRPWWSRAGLKLPHSKIRQKILACEFWNPATASSAGSSGKGTGL